MNGTDVSRTHDAAAGRVVRCSGCEPEGASEVVRWVWDSCSCGLERRCFTLKGLVRRG